MAKVSASLYVGSLAELEGEQCVIADFDIQSNACSVAFSQGGSKTVSADQLTLPKSLDKSGLENNAERFDVFIGPNDKVQDYAESISISLAEKGFCVMRMCHDDLERSAAVRRIEALAEEGSLERLAAEVEEGYLGAGMNGIVGWIDEESEALDFGPFVHASDDFFSKLMISLLPYSTDCFGTMCEHRTSGLVSFSISHQDAINYPHSLAEDKILGDFLRTWRRGHLRGVQFMGPGVGTVTLVRDMESQVKVPVPFQRATISVGPNTVLLFRPPLFRYELDLPPSSACLSVTFMEPESTLVLSTPGDPSILGEIYPGPEPPTGKRATCQHAHTRLAANWDTIEGYSGALAVGCDSATEFHKGRFDWELYYNPDPDSAGPWDLILRHMAYCEGLQQFDNKYFNIPAPEAMTMGPMQRHVLETGAGCLAKMGITKKTADREPHHAGCAVGLDKDDWNRIEKLPENEGGNNVIAIISNRFSYAFNLKGSNYVCDTACSASLVATNFAKKLMADREYDALDFFICLGVHNCLAVWGFKATAVGMNSIEGRCKTFNDSADGYLRGDGCSCFIMKWGDYNDLPDAIITGSMSGQNGRSATLTAPNGLAQEDVCWRAIREAKVNPGESSVWSCHGTGTSLGDPIEIGSVRKIMKGNRKNILAVNTNKTNTGHLEGGAAMTSILAAMWQCRMMRVNPTIHLGMHNPHIVFDEFDARFFNEMSPPGIAGAERRQGFAHVSSFGFGGTNAHAVFWGRDLTYVPDVKKLFNKRLSMMSPPEIHPIGTNPADWEHNLPDNTILPGTVYSIPMSKDDPEDAPIQYVKEEEGFQDGATECDVAYSINYTDIDGVWATEPMDLGAVSGLRSSYLEVPESGHIEFNFSQTVMPDLVVAPAVNMCTRKTSIVGPAEGLTNKWVIAGKPGTTMRIDLFASLGVITVSWLRVPDSLVPESIRLKSVMDLLDDL